MTSSRRTLCIRGRTYMGVARQWRDADACACVSRHASVKTCVVSGQSIDQCRKNNKERIYVRKRQMQCIYYTTHIYVNIEKYQVYRKSNSVHHECPALQCTAVSAASRGSHERTDGAFQSACSTHSEFWYPSATFVVVGPKLSYWLQRLLGKSQIIQVLRTYTHWKPVSFWIGLRLARRCCT